MSWSGIRGYHIQCIFNLFTYKSKSLPNILFIFIRIQNELLCMKETYVWLCQRNISFVYFMSELSVSFVIKPTIRWHVKFIAFAKFKRCYVFWHVFLRLDWSFFKELFMETNLSSWYSSDVTLMKHSISAIFLRFLSGFLHSFLRLLLDLIKHWGWFRK